MAAHDRWTTMTFLAGLRASPDTSRRWIAHWDARRDAVQARVNRHLATNQARNKLCNLYASYDE